MRNVQRRPRTWRRYAPIFVIASMAALASCEKDTNAITVVTPPATPAPVVTQPIIGVAEVTFRDIGTPQMTSDVILAPTMAELEALRSSRAVNPSAPSTVGVPIQLTLLAVTTFAFTPLAGGQTRYIRATYGLRNTRTDSVAFDPRRENLTFVGIASSNSIDQTEVRSLLRSDGSPATQSLALQLAPAGLLADNGSGGLVDLQPNALKTLQQAAVVNIKSPAGVTKVLLYGFAVRAAPVTPVQFDGDVTFSYLLPDQSNRADNPTTISVLLLIVNETVVQLAQGALSNGKVCIDLRSRV